MKVAVRFHGADAPSVREDNTHIWIGHGLRRARSPCARFRSSDMTHELSTPTTQLCKVNYKVELLELTARLFTRHNVLVANRVKLPGASPRSVAVAAPQ